MSGSAYCRTEMHKEIIDGIKIICSTNDSYDVKNTHNSYDVKNTHIDNVNNTSFGHVVIREILSPTLGATDIMAKIAMGTATIVFLVILIIAFIHLEVSLTSFIYYYMSN